MRENDRTDVVEIGGPEGEPAGFVRGHVPEELASFGVGVVADGGADAVALVQQLDDAPPVMMMRRPERRGGGSGQ